MNAIVACVLKKSGFSFIPNPVDFASSMFLFSAGLSTELSDRATVEFEKAVNEAFRPSESYLPNDSARSFDA